MIGRIWCACKLASANKLRHALRLVLCRYMKPPGYDAGQSKVSRALAASCTCAAAAAWHDTGCNAAASTKQQGCNQVDRGC